MGDGCEKMYKVSGPSLTYKPANLGAMITAFGGHNSLGAAIREWQRLSQLASRMEAAGRSAREIYDRMQDLSRHFSSDPHGIQGAIDRTNQAAEDAHFEKALNERSDKMSETRPAEEVTDRPQTIEARDGGEAAGAAGAATGKGTETAIMRQPKRIRWNLPDYNHAKLVYVFYTDVGTVDTGAFNTGTTDLNFNMNGCHDIIETNAQYTALRDNFTVATTVDTNLNVAPAGNQPRGWTYWRALYDKYTVLNCEYDITATLWSSGGMDNDEPIADSLDAPKKPLEQFFFGNEIGAASNDYNTSALVIMSDLAIKHHQIVPFPNAGWEDNQFGATNDLAYRRRRNAYTHTFTGNANQSTYEKFAREVTDDDTNVIWASTQANPALVHRLKLGVRPLGGHYQAGERLQYRGRLIYTVQFRQKVSTMHGYNMSLVPA